MNDKGDVVCIDTHTHIMECYSAIKKNEMPFAATWMDPEIVIISKISQEETDKYYMISLMRCA